MTNVTEHTRHRLDDSCIFIKNGRTTRFSKVSSFELSDHAMSICWPTMSLISNTGDPSGAQNHFARGGYIGSNTEGYADLNKNIDCYDLSEHVMDLAIAIAHALQDHLDRTGFIWDSVFVGLDVDEKYLRKLPAKGYALMLLMGEFSGVSYSTGNCTSTISMPGDMMIVRPKEIKNGNLGSKGCFTIVLYESGTRDDHRPIDEVGRQKTIHERWAENEDLEEAMTVDAPTHPDEIHRGPLWWLAPAPQGSYGHGGPSDALGECGPSVAVGPPGHYNLVQACCERGNHLHKRTKINSECHFIDITIDDDFTTPKRRQMATDGLRGP